MGTRGSRKQVSRPPPGRSRVAASLRPPCLRAHVCGWGRGGSLLRGLVATCRHHGPSLPKRVSGPWSPRPSLRGLSPEHPQGLGWLSPDAFQSRRCEPCCAVMTEGAGPTVVWLPRGLWPGLLTRHRQCPLCPPGLLGLFRGLSSSFELGHGHPRLGAGHRGGPPAGSSENGPDPARAADWQGNPWERQPDCSHWPCRLLRRGWGGGGGWEAWGRRGRRRQGRVPDHFPGLGLDRREELRACCRRMDLIAKQQESVAAEVDAEREANNM